ncbi:replication initiator protein A [Pectinatus frisingensis]|uniref:replication initiator protein A n=1 Tax=Pectinatus frisingensis TaxID=865 RepID=UPI0018C77BD6|nr:replication initiator protein A [Pectinatus frisingensis]
MERYKLGDIDNERYYQIPKSLFSGQSYKGLGLDAKVIYAFLKDRMELSRRNKWIDENGDIYLLFSQEKIADLLDTSVSTISRAFSSLKKYELIDIERQGLGLPNKIYIRRILICTDASQTCTDDVSGFAPVQGNEPDLNDPDLNEPENKVLTPISPTGDRPVRLTTSSLSNKQQDLFNQFWQSYPKKIGKGAAEKAWNKIKPDKDLFEKMLFAIYQAKHSRQWQKDNGQYIPNPSTWLNQKRWEDELQENTTGQLNSPQADMAQRAIEEIMRHG